MQPLKTRQRKRRTDCQGFSSANHPRTFHSELLTSWGEDQKQEEKLPSASTKHQSVARRSGQCLLPVFVSNSAPPSNCRSHWWDIVVLSSLQFDQLWGNGCSFSCVYVFIAKYWKVYDRKRGRRSITEQAFHLPLVRSASSCFSP